MEKAYALLSIDGNGSYPAYQQIKLPLELDLEQDRSLNYPKQRILKLLRIQHLSRSSFAQSKAAEFQIYL